MSYLKLNDTYIKLLQTTTEENDQETDGNIIGAC